MELGASIFVCELPFDGNGILVFSIQVILRRDRHFSGTRPKPMLKVMKSRVSPALVTLPVIWLEPCVKLSALGAEALPERSPLLASEKTRTARERAVLAKREVIMSFMDLIRSEVGRMGEE